MRRYRTNIISNEHLMIHFGNEQLTRAELFSLLGRMENIANIFLAGIQEKYWVNNFWQNLLNLHLRWIQFEMNNYIAF